MIDDELALGYDEETPVPEHGPCPMDKPVVRTPKKNPGRSRLSREEALLSSALYDAKKGKRGVRKAYKALGDDVSFSRFVRVPGFVPKHQPKQLAFNHRHPAFIEGRSIFSDRGVKEPSEFKNLLVSGHSNVKIGRDVRKGRFRGYWIYTLSLEERKTCPRSCLHWKDCYGNNMPFAKRVNVTPDNRLAFEQKLGQEVAHLTGLKSRAGLLVRLHALGDFFDEDYVLFWDWLLARHENLACFGYTARRPDDPIGARIAELKEQHGRRFAIRWSDGGLGRDCTVSLAPNAPVPVTAFACPEQSGLVDGCGKCGACWTGDKDVGFRDH